MKNPKVGDMYRLTLINGHIGVVGLDGGHLPNQTELMITISQHTNERPIIIVKRYKEPKTVVEGDVPEEVLILEGAYFGNDIDDVFFELKEIKSV